MKKTSKKGENRVRNTMGYKIGSTALFVAMNIMFYKWMPYVSGCFSKELSKISNTKNDNDIEPVIEKKK